MSLFTAKVETPETTPPKAPRRRSVTVTPMFVIILVAIVSSTAGYLLGRFVRPDRFSSKLQNAILVKEALGDSAAEWYFKQ